MRGKALNFLKSIAITKDHPRLCGEKLLPQSSIPAAAGSPPPMRGKVAGIAALIAIFGITPAYAGKRICRRRTHAGMRDHPRLCGEKQRKKTIFGILQGSPPPMRGKVSGELLDINQYGITPAYAGKRMNVTESVILQQDHPRLCGEKQKSFVT